MVDIRLIRCRLCRCRRCRCLCRRIPRGLVHVRLVRRRLSTIRRILSAASRSPRHLVHVRLVRRRLSTIRRRLSTASRSPRRLVDILRSPDRCNRALDGTSSVFTIWRTDSSRSAVSQSIRIRGPAPRGRLIEKISRQPDNRLILNSYRDIFSWSVLLYRLSRIGQKPRSLCGFSVGRPKAKRVQ